MAYNWRKQASVSYGYASSRLALNVYMFFERMPDSYEKEQEWRQEADGRFLDLLGLFLTEGTSGELAQGELGSFRRQLRQRMETVVAFSDAFEIYEYALNRMERKFVTGLPVTKINEEQFVGNLMRYLTSTKEPAVQNQRIQQIVGQLPIRFTRQKFYSLVHEGLAAYIGSDLTGLEEVMYLLRSGSMLELTEKRREDYPLLSGLLTKLEGMSFKELTKEEYEEARKKIDLASGFLTEESEYILTLQEMVNDLYVLFLTRDDALRDAKENRHVHRIFEELWQRYKAGTCQVPKELEEELEGLEGIQEKYDEEYQRLDLSWEYQALDGETARRARLVEKLMSTSEFASLEEEGAGGSASRQDVEAAAKGFFEQLGPVFAASQKPVTRAVMAMVLSSLPVFFHSPKEIQCYIKDSLSCCTDQAEKETCLELLRQMMESDGYELV